MGLGAMLGSVAVPTPAGVAFADGGDPGTALGSTVAAFDGALGFGLVPEPFSNPDVLKPIAIVSKTLAPW